VNQQRKKDWIQIHKKGGIFMDMKTEAFINAAVAAVVLVTGFFNAAFSTGVAVAFLVIAAAYKYFNSPKQQETKTELKPEIK
jgi:hypothetical protein